MRIPYRIQTVVPPKGEGGINVYTTRPMNLICVWYQYLRPYLLGSRGSLTQPAVKRLVHTIKAFIDTFGLIYKKLKCLLRMAETYSKKMADQNIIQEYTMMRFKLLGSKKS